MIVIDTKNLILGKRNNIVDENDELVYWTQPDFSYKHRVHIYRADNSEVGYVQYKILSIQKDVEYYDYMDNRLEFSNYKIVNKKSNFEYDIECDNDVTNITHDGERCYIESNTNLDKCLLLFFGNLK